MLVAHPRTEKQFIDDITCRLEQIINISSEMKRDIDRIKWYKFQIDSLNKNISFLTEDFDSFIEILKYEK